MSLASISKTSRRSRPCSCGSGASSGTAPLTHTPGIGEQQGLGDLLRPTLGSEVMIVASPR
jgi:hypothetical protein